MTVLFTISREDITTSFDIVDFSETERYHTIKYVDDEKKGEGDISSNDITNRKVDWISDDEYTDWMNAVYKFINTHNEKVDNGTTGNIVEFVITDMDDRGACTYQKKINNKVTDEGKGWYKNLSSNEEKEAWKKALIKFKKENGMSLATQKIDELIEQINEAIDSLDGEMPDDFNLTPPMIEDALQKIDDDPCDFISNIKQGVNDAVMTINGLPSPKEIINYYAKLIKDNLQTAKKIATDSQAGVVKYYTYPVTETIQDSKEYFAQLDALDAEIRKNNSDDICIFETVLEKPYVYSPPTYTYETMEETSYEGVSIDDLENVPEPTSVNFTRTSYKEVEPDIIAKGGTMRSGHPNTNVEKYIYNHIYDALQNCWIPLRIAWEQYCNQRGMISRWTITSGYRRKDPNAHGYGYAIDVQPYFKTKSEKKAKVIELASFIYQYCKAHREIKVDQILREFSTPTSTWCHIGYKSPKGAQRGQYYANYDQMASSGHHGTMQLV